MLLFIFYLNFLHWRSLIFNSSLLTAGGNQFTKSGLFIYKYIKKKKKKKKKKSTILCFHCLSDIVAAVNAKRLLLIGRNQCQNNLETRKKWSEALFCHWEGCISCDDGLNSALGILYFQYCQHYVRHCSSCKCQTTAPYRTKSMPE